MRFQAFTSKPFEMFRSDLDQSLARSFASHVMQRSWKDQILSIHALGSNGFVQFDNGGVRAEIRMSFPATLMKDQIVSDIQRALTESSGGAVQTFE